MAGNVQYVTGDMFTTTQPAFGHGVNTQGVMGSGIAKIIRNLYPDVFPPYKKACDDGSLTGGGILPVQIENGPIILNIASQEKPGANATYEFLRESIENTFRYAYHAELTGFALPRIASDIGGLEWKKVSAIIEEIAADYPDITVELWSLPGAD